MNTSLNKSKIDAKYIIKSAIGILIMVCFRFIPPVAPITEVGMAVIGEFIGLIYLWTFVDMVWPTFVGIVMFGFISQQVYPNSYAMAGIYEAGAQSIGSWTVLLLIGLLFFTEVLNEIGIIRRVSLWFVTRKVAYKGGWSFTIMYFLAVYVIGLFLNCTALQIIVLAVAKEIFELAGMDENDKWPRVITVGATFICIITFCMTPYCHDLTLLFMGIYSAIAGVPVNWLSYMAVSIPVGTAIIALMIAFFAVFIRPDMSKLKQMDFTKLEALRPGPMERKEKFVLLVTGLLFITWIIPGFLSIFLPDAAVTAWFEKITMVTPLYVAVILFAVVRFNEKPILNIGEASSKIGWPVVFFLAGIMMIANAMGEATTGISDWVMATIQPVVGGMSPYVMVAVLAILAIILTNVANNVPTGIIFISIGVPLSLQMGINPFVTAVAITLGAQFAYCIPPAFVPIGLCYADKFGGAKYTFKWGVVTTLISVIVAGLLIYPLANLIGG